MDRVAHRVPNTPPGTTAYLLRDWCTSSEEEYLLGRVYHGSASSKKKWTEVSGRRLQNLGGVVHPKGLIPTPVPEWLAAQMAKVRASAGDLLPAPINHVLVNEYQPGDGILPHQDGAAYYPAVAIVSLGCDAVMRFAPRRDETSNETKTSDDDGSLRSGSVSRPFGVFLPRRSLLVFDGALYERYLHGIDAVREDVIDATVANRGDVAANDSSKIRSRSDEDVAARGDVDAFPTLRRDRVRVSMTFRNVRVVRAALRLFG
jgi:alkylated DNA repair protein alkB family protein 6